MLELKELEELSPTSWLGVKVKCLVAINKEPTICEAKFNLPTSYFLLIGMSFGSQILILYTVGLQI